MVAKTFKFYANEEIYFTAGEVEIITLSLTGLKMTRHDFHDLLNFSTPYYNLKDDIINDLQVNLLNNVIGFDKSLVEQIIEKIEMLTIPELQQFYTTLYKANDFFNMIEFYIVSSK